ncbi:hypothetical protein D1007_01317 [Hordeum vulgare]|nr:hypothetical protein D1007_01317 [Hordeum vulgare]
MNNAMGVIRGCGFARTPSAGALAGRTCWLGVAPGRYGGRTLTSRLRGPGLGTKGGTYAHVPGPDDPNLGPEVVYPHRLQGARRPLGDGGWNTRPCHRCRLCSVTPHCPRLG